MDFRKNDFLEKGYCVIENFASKETLDALRKRAVEISSQSTSRSVFTTGDEQHKTTDRWFMESGDKIRCFMEDGADASSAVNKIGHALHDLDDCFNEFSYSSAMKEVVGALGEFSDPRVVQSMYIFKAPGFGGPVRPHQDAAFLITEPEASVVGFWLAIDDAHKGNGCLWAVPGSHKSVPVEIQFVRNDDGSGAHFETVSDCKTVSRGQQFSTEGAVPLEVPAGTLVLIHGRLVHFSEPNLSDQPRNAYTLHMVEMGKRENVQFHYSKKNWLQRDQFKKFFEV